jgi:hypothetical protein
VLALCWAQALGLVHRSLHGPVAASYRAAEWAASPWAIAHAHDHAHAPAHAEDSSVFGHTQHQSVECRLFDQLLLVDLLSAGNPASAPAPSLVGSSADVASGRDGEAPSAYWARGPPVIG